MIKVLLAIAALAVAIWLSLDASRTWRGTVYEEEQRTPVVMATVLLHDDTGIVARGTTDMQGRFELRIPPAALGPAALRVCKIGYRRTGRLAATFQRGGARSSGRFLDSEVRLRPLPEGDARRPTRADTTLPPACR